MSTTATARRSRVAGGAAAGGDVSVVRTLRDGRVVLAVVDVSGHGEDAAPLAARLERRLRALAAVGTTPACALAALDAELRDADDEALATAAYAVVDPVAGTAVCASAGHPPLVVVDAAGATLLPVPPGPPLGLASAYDDVVLPVGGLLLAYTDGLVERRGEDLDSGLDRLLATLEAGDAQDVGGLVDGVFSALAVGSDDDVLLAAVTIPEPDLPGRAPVRQDRPASARYAVDWEPATEEEPWRRTCSCAPTWTSTRRGAGARASPARPSSCAAPPRPRRTRWPAASSRRPSGSTTGGSSSRARASPRWAPGHRRAGCASSRPAGSSCRA
ncbi:PP2C family protein-serine/threonine phosphatase [Motilibacter rhizosphaerae]|uniref:PP2C family protein-serine/threonine phosphatase n=1 Tax=Motilibacter rhizosphaerae TaxID=598652 RepID=UPI00102C8144|nr:PP2C family protein-serine/threonine phosphatase [Motilibacter rhizosphaerae]